MIFGTLPWKLIQHCLKDDRGVLLFSKFGFDTLVQNTVLKRRTIKLVTLVLNVRERRYNQNRGFLTQNIFGMVVFERNRNVLFENVLYMQKL